MHGSETPLPSINDEPCSFDAGQCLECLDASADSINTDKRENSSQTFPHVVARCCKDVDYPELQSPGHDPLLMSGLFLP